MRFRGFKEEDIQAMLVETPRRILAFAAPLGLAGDRGRGATPGHRDRPQADLWASWMARQTRSGVAGMSS
jgi:hypothetical protein